MSTRKIVRNAQRGMTLLEIMIVLAILALVMGFLVGPRISEITGVFVTPDERTMFVGIQHPGEAGSTAAPSSNWPQSQAGIASGRPRSAIVAITRNDGGVVGL